MTRELALRCNWACSLSRLAPVVLAIAALSPSAQAIDFGVHLHYPSGTAETSQIAAIMKQRNFVTARTDYNWGDGSRWLVRDQAIKIRANGGRSNLQVVLNTQYTFNHSCPQDFANIEQTAYTQTASLVNEVKDVIHDFELMNETQSRPEVQGEVPRNSAWLNASAYEGKPCFATMAAVLRGMSRAIADVRAASGLPLRRILGVAGRDWAILDFMKSRGVEFDVVGFHAYPNFNNASLLSDPWYGPGGPLAQAAKYGKPVHINEFHCDEIYTANTGGYNDQAWSPQFEQCLKSVDRHLAELTAQSIAKIESIHFYELRNDPIDAGAEGVFGLMYSLTRPKPNLFLATAYAGGELTPLERAEITRRGLMTDAEIDLRRAAAAARRH